MRFVPTAISLLCALFWTAPAVATEVVLVANAEGGTVDIVDANAFEILRSIDALPDGADAGLEDNPTQALLGQQIVEAAGGNNYAQDQDVSPDGRTLYVSRGHRGDVAAFDIASGELLWKVAIPGLRSDHMTISGDGSRLYVSALTDDHVYVVDTAAHAISGSFPTGEWPHDNHLSHDGRLLYNGSIGNIVAPPEARGRGSEPYRLTVADAATLEQVNSHVFDAGIRPYVLTHDETRMYAQLSEFHGVIEYDLKGRRELRRRELPIDAGVTEEDYDFEAPHHGLAMTPDERTLCAAGRASDYVALIDTRSLEPTAIIEVDDAPGWATLGPDGTHCFVPNTRADTLSVISIGERKEVERLNVGDGPKQIEAARLPRRVVCSKSRARGCRPRLRLRTRCLASGKARLTLRGELDAVRSVGFSAGRADLGNDRKRPFERVLPARLAGARVTGRADVTRGPKPTLVRRALVPRCR